VAPPPLWAIIDADATISVAIVLKARIKPDAFTGSAERVVPFWVIETPPQLNRGHSAR
jgi:hypothetical protein